MIHWSYETLSLESIILGALIIGPFVILLSHISQWRFSSHSTSSKPSAGTISAALLWHINGLLRKGYAEQLMSDDLPSLPGTLRSSNMRLQMQSAWDGRGSESLSITLPLCS